MKTKIKVPWTINKNYFCAILFILAGLEVKSQITPPEINWKRSDWAPEHLANGPQTQNESSEDWWYDHKNSYVNDKLNGFITCGYSMMRNYLHSEDAYDGCVEYTSFGGQVCGWFECAGNRKGTSFGTMALIAPDGKTRLWFKTFVQDELHRVIQTSDGGYLAVGNTVSTRTFEGDFIYYNPDGINSDFFEDGVNCIMSDDPKSHAYAVKVDADGNVEWQFIYGMYDFAIDDELAYENHAMASDVAEVLDGTNAGNFIIVGYGQDGTYGRACLWEIKSDGELIQKQFVENNVNNSRARALVIYEESSDVKIVIAGHKDDTDLTGAFTKLFVVKYDYDNSAFPTPATITQDWAPVYYQEDGTGDLSGYRNSWIWDVDVNNSRDKIFLPGIVSCSFCIYADETVENLGLCRVYVLDPADGSTTSPNYIDFGEVLGYDLQVGIIPTDDDGFALVSTKVVSPFTSEYPFFTPYCCYSQIGQQSVTPEGFWNSDAYVAKADASGNIEWETTFDRYPLVGPQQYPADVKKQECLYSISEGEDGGFVISGNYSANFDDCYLAKLYGDCQQRSNYDVDNTEINITTNTTWNTSRTIRGSVHITSGDILTIDGATIEFADSKRSLIVTNLIIEPGAKLILKNGAILTSNSNCPASMWDGIQVLGDYWAPQEAAYQGYLVIEASGATIENARTGILVSSANATLGDVNSNGGIVEAINGIFLNNHRDVVFMPYQNFDSGLLPNVSYFRECEFKCDNVLNDPDYSDAGSRRLGTTDHVYLEGVDRIQFLGCDFTTDQTNHTFPADLRGTGIRSVNASYSVLKYSSTISSFNNLHYGIHSTGISQNLAIAPRVQQCSFINNHRAIYMKNTSLQTVIKNYIEVAPSEIIYQPFAIAFSNAYGIYFDRCTGFRLEENDIECAGTCHNWTPSPYVSFLPPEVGIVVNNSGASANKVYKNDLTDMPLGGIAMTSPVDANSNSGLSFLCNINTNNPSVDMGITGGAIANQGTPSISAGDQFSQTCGGTAWDIFANTGVSAFDYYYDPASQTDKPDCWTSGIVFPLAPTSITLRSCSASYTDVLAAKSFINAYPSAVISLKSKIDRGNTSALLNWMRTHTGQQLYDTLYAISPYLSDSALVYTVNRYHNSNLSLTQFKNIILANARDASIAWDAMEPPYIALSQNVIDSINLLSLHDSIQNKIDSALVGKSPRQFLEEDIVYYAKEKKLAQDAIIRFFIQAGDTLDNTSWVDSVIVYLDTVGNTDAKMQLLSLLEWKGDLDDATNLNEELGGIADLENFSAMHEIIIALKLDTLTPYIMIDSIELRETVESIALDMSKSGYEIAHAMLSMVFGTQYPEAIDPLNLSEEEERIEAYQQSNVSTDRRSSNLNLYPNPADRSVTIEVMLDDGSQNGQLVLYDFQGKEVATYHIEAGKNTINISLASYMPGVYLCVARSNSGILNKEKLVVLSK